MSHYLPLRPLGEGTKEIESLASFVLRAAQGHGVSVMQFVRHLSNWALRDAIIDGELTHNLIHGGFGCTALAGYHEQVLRFVAALERGFAYKYFRRCTLLSLAGAVTNQPMCIRSTRAWCPACMQEAVIAGDVYYDQLLWAISLQQRCTAHRLRLMTSCPACGMPQKYGHRSGNLLVCWKCQVALTCPSDRWEPDLDPSPGEKHLLELVAEIATGGIEQAHPEPIAAYREAQVRMLSHPTKRAVVGMRGYRLIGAKYTLGQQRLEVLVSVADDEGVALVDLLRTPVETARRSGGLKLDLAANDRAKDEQHDPEARFDEAIAQALREQIDTPHSERVPGWKAVAQRFLVCYGYLLKHHRDLLHDLGKRRMSELFRYRIADRLELAHAVVSSNLLSILLRGHDDGATEFDAMCLRAGVGARWQRQILAMALASVGMIRSPRKRNKKPKNASS